MLNQRKLDKAQEDNLLGISKFIEAEGFTGEIEDDSYDPWQEIFAARQNETILQTEIRGIEYWKAGDGQKKEPCIVVMIGHVKGIIPLRSTRYNKLTQLRKQAGQNIAYVITTIIRDEDIFLGDQLLALKKMQENFFSTAKVGMEVVGTVREANPYVAKVDVGGILTELPAAEADHGWVHDLTEYLSPGKSYKFKITALDKEKGQVTISRKAVLPDPWPLIIKTFNKGAEVVGKVTGITEYGTFVELGPNVYGLSPHKQFLQLKTGDRVLYKIFKVDNKHRKITGQILTKLRS